MLDRQTFEKFGYFASELHPGSKKRMVFICPSCEGVFDTQRRYYKEGRLCLSCNGRKQIQENRSSKPNTEPGLKALEKHRAKLNARGLHPNGNKLVDEKDKKGHKKKYHREWRRNLRSTLKGKIANRLSVALRKALKGANTTVLPYSKDDLAEYVQGRLEYHNYKCPLCGTSIKDEFDIDHKMPLSSAKTEDEVIKLFALSNLDTLCPKCNRHVKKDRIISY